MHCRRCGADLETSAAFCSACGTRQAALPKERTPALSGRAPGWFPDPFGRARLRYWDGEIWTANVDGDAGALDLLSIDETRSSRVSDGAWRASVGSLAISMVGLVVSFGLSFLFVLPLLLTHRPGGSIVLLVVSEAGLWSGLLATCRLTSKRYGTGHFLSDFRVRFRWVDIAIGIGGAIAARCVASFVVLPFLHTLRSAGNPDSALDSIIGLGAIGWTVLVLLTCVGAPIVEELFFRGLLQGQLVERIGPGLAIFVTSVLFGAVHIANDPGVAGLLLALIVGASGLVLGAVRHLTGRLGSSIATHALFNVTAIAALAALQSR